MVVKVLANKQEMELEYPGHFGVVVRTNGTNLKVPDYFEISPETTLKFCREELTEEQWDWIRSSPMFVMVFNEFFQGRNKIDIPETLEDLRDCDLGVMHVVGLIILIFENTYCDKPKNLFIRDPETYLHPGVVYTMMSALGKLIPHIILSPGERLKQIAEEEAKTDGKDTSE